MGMRKDDKKPFGWPDFLIAFAIDQKEKPPQTAKQVERILLRWAKITNSRFAQQARQRPN